MNKLKTFCLSLITIMGLSLTSCSGSASSSFAGPSPEEVMTKINSGGSLDVADYAVMVDYINDFCDEGDSSDGSYEAGREAGERYPYFFVFGLTLENAVKTTPDNVGDVAAAKSAVNRLMNALNN